MSGTSIFMLRKQSLRPHISVMPKINFKTAGPLLIKISLLSDTVHSVAQTGSVFSTNLQTGVSKEQKISEPFSAADTWKGDVLVGSKQLTLLNQNNVHVCIQQIC